MTADIDPELRTTRFVAADGTRLEEYAIQPDPARAVALIVHGYGDHAARYAPLMRVLSERGVAAQSFDFRGHGRAGGRRGHVREFGEYVSDLACALARVRQAYPGVPLFLVAHSQGALVSLTWLTADPSRPPELAGLVVTGAYLDLAMQPSALQRLEAWLFGRLWPSLTIKNPMRSEQLTRDPEILRELRADPHRHGIVTPGWFLQSRAAQRALAARWAEVDLPLLVIHGAADTVAAPDAARRFFEAASSTDKRWVSLEGGRHEPFFDLERDRVMRLVADWLVEHLGQERAGRERAGSAGR